MWSRSGGEKQRSIARQRSMRKRESGEVRASALVPYTWREEARRGRAGRRQGTDAGRAWLRVSAHPHRACAVRRARAAPHGRLSELVPSREHETAPFVCRKVSCEVRCDV